MTREIKEKIKAIENRMEWIDIFSMDAMDAMDGETLEVLNKEWDRLEKAKADLMAKLHGE